MMADVDLERRVRILEEKMNELRDVPVRLAAVESQIVQLRGEMQGGFSALRADLARLDERTVRLNQETRAEAIRLNEETRVHMRVLHEEVIARIALLQEGLQPPRSRPRPARRKKG